MYRLPDEQEEARHGAPWLPLNSCRTPVRPSARGTGQQRQILPVGGYIRQERRG